MDCAYGEDWFKIRNPHYSQYEGRRELFEKRSYNLHPAAAILASAASRPDMENSVTLTSSR